MLLMHCCVDKTNTSWSVDLQPHSSSARARMRQPASPASAAPCTRCWPRKSRHQTRTPHSPAANHHQPFRDDTDSCGLSGGIRWQLRRSCWRPGRCSRTRQTQRTGTSPRNLGAQACGENSFAHPNNSANKRRVLVVLGWTNRRPGRKWSRKSCGRRR